MRRRPAPRIVTRPHPLLSDDLLLQAVDQLRANVSGVPVGSARPAYYGMPRAQADDRLRLRGHEAEARRRGLI